jgi:hypothetical protein
MMNRVLSIALACSFAGLLGLGVVTLTGAQPPDPEPSARQKLRARLVDLRTEVEVLKLEHDADKEDLRASLTTVRKLQRDGLDKDVLKAIQYTVEIFRTALPLNNEEDLARVLQAIEVQTRTADKHDVFLKYFRQKGFQKVDADELGPLLVDREVKMRIESSLKAIDQKKARFVEAARQLHTKQLDLEDAERRYRETR